MANGLPNGMKLQSILKDPSYEKDGQVYIDPDWLKWADVSDEFVVSDPSQCEHGEQVCSECVDFMRRVIMANGLASGMRLQMLRTLSTKKTVWTKKACVR
jgi:hypothetical protein